MTTLHHIAPDERWRPFLTGDLIVTEHLRGEAANTIVARRVPPGPAGPGGRALAWEEMLLAIERARGTPIKVLAVDHGRPSGTIARRIATAMRKLKLRSQAELVALLGSWPALRHVEPASRDDRDVVTMTYPAPLWALPACFSEAEGLVVRDAIAGASHDAIARARGIATRTVANHLASVYRKMGVHSRIELFVALASRSPQRESPLVEDRAREFR